MGPHGGAPELLQKIMAKDFADDRRLEIKNMVLERWRLLREQGRHELEELGQIDLDRLLDFLAAPRVKASHKKVISALLWGTLPTGDWMHLHS